MTNLQRKRHEYGISQSELAEKSGVNIRTLQRYEQEKDKMRIEDANLKTILNLAFALDCVPSDILDSEYMREFLSTYEL